MSLTFIARSKGCMMKLSNSEVIQFLSTKMLRGEIRKDVTAEQFSSAMSTLFTQRELEKSVEAKLIRTVESSERSDVIRPIDEVIKEHILACYSRQPNKKHLADELRVSRSTLFRWFKEWGIE